MPKALFCSIANYFSDPSEDPSGLDITRSDHTSTDDDQVHALGPLSVSTQASDDLSSTPEPPSSDSLFSVTSPKCTGSFSDSASKLDSDTAPKRKSGQHF